MNLRILLKDLGLMVEDPRDHQRTQKLPIPNWKFKADAKPSAANLPNKVTPSTRAKTRKIPIVHTDSK